MFNEKEKRNKSFSIRMRPSVIVKLKTIQENLKKKKKKILSEADILEQLIERSHTELGLSKKR